MVSKKRLDFGFHGYRAPIVPKAPRSIRRRSPNKNSVEDSKLCAFELLAAVAGKLLLESESSASSNVADAKVQLDISQDGNEKGPPVDDKAVKSDSFDHGSCAESAFVPELSGTSDVLKKGDCDSKPEKVESGHEMLSEDDKSKVVIDDLSKATNTIAVKDPNEECVNTDNILINSESSVQLPLYRVDPVPDALMQKHWNNVKLGIRDDDENSYGCKKFSTKVVNKPVRPQPHMGHRRIRKMLTSKYRKVAPKWKSCELYNNSERVKSFYQHRKRIYTQQRCQQAPIKKRKLSDHSFAAAYDQDTSSDSISSLPEKGMRKDKSGSGVVSETASGASATVKGHQRAKDRHVKFSIKSFRVPELYIEVPETASVASLKRTVMEAVTAILGRGIRVGVVLQGKKVRDDNRTLQQAGISQSNNLDSLGFMLEPSFTHVSPSKTPKKLPSILPCDADQESPRSPATPMIDSVISEASVDPPTVAKFDEDMQNNNELIVSPQTPMDEEAVSDSKALVAVNSPDSLEALAVVPVNPKPKRSELSQRRTRRPFTVTEVEALVGAVEKLGTGRWRDVKMGAFENADHRTYVDLKDKWKTLVHTASISPQQRRGEPVPQELLDRVLSAHSYWSQHQSKQHGNGKNPVESTARTGEEIVGA